MTTVQVMAKRHRRHAVSSGFGTAFPVLGGSYGSMSGYYGGGWAGDGGLGPGGVAGQVGDSCLSLSQFGGISGTGADGMGNGAGGGTAQGGSA